MIIRIETITEAKWNKTEIYTIEDPTLLFIPKFDYEVTYCPLYIDSIEQCKFFFTKYNYKVSINTGKDDIYFSFNRNIDSSPRAFLDIFRDVIEGNTL